MTETTGKLDLKLPGPDQRNATFGVEEEPLIVIELAEQVIIPPVAEAFGAAKSPKTTAFVELVQPLLAVTVTW